MIAMLVTLQTIVPPMPLIMPSRRERAFACTSASKSGEPILIALPDGLNRSEVLVSDPSRRLGRYTLNRYTWQIGVDGRLAIAFSSNGDAKSPVFKVQQVNSNADSYQGRSHPFNRPAKVTHYSCRAIHGEQAVNTIKLIRAGSR